MQHERKYMLRIALLISLVSGSALAGQLAIPVDPDQFRQANAKLIALAQSGEDAALLVQARRTLELVPNEPALQAPIYLLMSAATRHLGENARAEAYEQAAHALDPSLAPAAAAGTTRGSTSDTVQQAIGIAAQSVGAYQQIKIMQLCLEMVKHHMTPPPQCGAQQAGVPIAAGQPMPIQPMSAPPMSAPPMSAPPMSAPPMSAPTGFSQPLDQPPGALPLASTPPISYPPAPAVAQSMPPAPMPAPIPAQASAPQQQQSPYPQQSTYPPQQPQQSQQQQTRAYQRPAARGRMRGEEEPSFRAIHDQSRVASAHYFDQSYGVLLSVSGTNLTVTSTSGEPLRVIPAADILEIRLNSLIGREQGVFHIATREGLYLALAPESLDRDQARAMIEALRAKLDLVE
jgi:hypothetical protein